jgi:hypothetical protein
MGVGVKIPDTVGKKYVDELKDYLAGKITEQEFRVNVARLDFADIGCFLPNPPALTTDENGNMMSHLECRGIVRMKESELGKNNITTEKYDRAVRYIEAYDREVTSVRHSSIKRLLELTEIAKELNDMAMTYKIADVLKKCHEFLGRPAPRITMEQAQERWGK